MEVLNEIVQIRIEPDKILHRKCKSVEWIGMEIRDFIEDMIDVATKHDALGLSAPQLGLTERIIIYKNFDGEFVPMINPKIVWSAKKITLSEEGCLSIPNTVVTVPRVTAIHVEYKDKFGNEKTVFETGQQSFIIQHEMDHLGGITLLSYVNQHKKEKQEANE